MVQIEALDEFLSEIAFRGEDTVKSTKSADVDIVITAAQVQCVFSSDIRNADDSQDGQYRNVSTTTPIGHSIESGRLDIEFNYPVVEPIAASVADESAHASHEQEGEPSVEISLEDSLERTFTPPPQPSDLEQSVQKAQKPSPQHQVYRSSFLKNVEDLSHSEKQVQMLILQDAEEMHLEHKQIWASHGPTISSSGTVQAAQDEEGGESSNLNYESYRYGVSTHEKHADQSMQRRRVVEEAIPVWSRTDISANKRTVQPKHLIEQHTGVYVKDPYIYVNSPASEHVSVGPHNATSYPGASNLPSKHFTSSNTMFTTLEFGDGAMEVHIARAVERQRLIEESLPLKKDDAPRLLLFDYLEKADPAARLIQSAWRAQRQRTQLVEPHPVQAEAAGHRQTEEVAPDTSAASSHHPSQTRSLSQQQQQQGLHKAQPVSISLDVLGAVFRSRQGARSASGSGAPFQHIVAKVNTRFSTLSHTAVKLPPSQQGAGLADEEPFSTSLMPKSLHSQTDVGSHRPVTAPEPLVTFSATPPASLDTFLVIQQHQPRSQQEPHQQQNKQQHQQQQQQQEQQLEQQQQQSKDVAIFALKHGVQEQVKKKKDPPLTINDRDKEPNDGVFLAPGPFAMDMSNSRFGALKSSRMAVSMGRKPPGRSLKLTGACDPTLGVYSGGVLDPKGPYADMIYRQSKNTNTSPHSSLSKAHPQDASPPRSSLASTSPKALKHSPLHWASSSSWFRHPSGSTASSLPARPSTSPAMPSDNVHRQTQGHRTFTLSSDDMPSNKKQDMGQVGLHKEGVKKGHVGQAQFSADMAGMTPPPPAQAMHVTATRGRKWTGWGRHRESSLQRSAQAALAAAAANGNGNVISTGHLNSAAPPAATSPSMLTKRVVGGYPEEANLTATKMTRSPQELSHGKNLETDRRLSARDYCSLDLMRSQMSSAPAGLSGGMKFKGIRYTASQPGRQSPSQPGRRLLSQPGRQAPVDVQAKVVELPPWRGFNPNPFGPQPYLRMW
ncbi:hypothetical protein CEUSTIGMA_g7692.t1 [Chlamydomonas eustigma]|uniref:Uncharacterized protein n=1 Tax=Chlamydomonas eustigma TaxID=1157962 RepID=A0A250XB17_9CHLO|nr:hypothetical protein CEUSTIGMA_g7692.t1 [Chlamydomonas eustigma]|eukprot:GAX80254.1 hypothetical protein CEUSTIGMA_g7692.t1 [Chlamydomonas eustigma]